MDSENGRIKRRTQAYFFEVLERKLPFSHKVSKKLAFCKSVFLSITEVNHHPEAVKLRAVASSDPLRGKDE